MRSLSASTIAPGTSPARIRRAATTGERVPVRDHEPPVPVEADVEHLVGRKRDALPFDVVRKALEQSADRPAPSTGADLVTKARRPELRSEERRCHHCFVDGCEHLHVGNLLREPDDPPRTAVPS
jgi:hypothetical protein